MLSVEAKLIALQPTMKVERQGQLYATVTKALFTLLHQHYTIQVEGGPAYQAEGDITNHEYEVRHDGNPVAQISSGGSRSGTHMGLRWPQSWTRL